MEMMSKLRCIFLVVITLIMACFQMVITVSLSMLQWIYVHYMGKTFQLKKVMHCFIL